MISESIIKTIKKARRIVVFSGAGMSAESGVPTFRDDLTGLWQQYDPMQLTTPEAFAADAALVWGWYEWRRTRILSVEPNPGHMAIAEWQKNYPLVVITQNVDDLHERAGSYNVIHIHGSIFSPRCIKCKSPHEFESTYLQPQDSGRRIDPPLCTVCGHLVRPGVVWFGEPLYEPDLRAAIFSAENCDLLLAIGTSGAVQPAALIPQWAKEKGAVVVQINPNPTPIDQVSDYNIRMTAAQALPQIVEALGFYDEA
ncbi:SIR2 family NAD-dependent protein deacylase [Paenalcaligenes faecalis]|uniref:SIR2 family NAD-dependent protein deacylase n=1 Tax=Paenalcaligenes faecalis TaxID=2980099 RepID=UPI0022B94702|nr:NAD-dependent deacylase [Paenalcaligenes faecalis]